VRFEPQGTGELDDRAPRQGRSERGRGVEGARPGQADAHPRPSLPADECEGGPTHLLGGLGLIGDVDDDDRSQAQGGGVRSDRSVVLTGIGLDGDRDDPGVDGLLEEAGDLEPAQPVGLADLDLRPAIEVVVAGQLREEPAVACGGCECSSSSLRRRRLCVRSYVKSCTSVWFVTQYCTYEH
jgi:hypothetical protein